MVTLLILFLFLREGYLLRGYVLAKFDQNYYCRLWEKRNLKLLFLKCYNKRNGKKLHVCHNMSTYKIYYNSVHTFELQRWQNRHNLKKTFILESKKILPQKTEYIFFYPYLLYTLRKNNFGIWRRSYLHTIIAWWMLMCFPTCANDRFISKVRTTIYDILTEIFSLLSSFDCTW